MTISSIANHFGIPIDFVSPVLHGFKIKNFETKMSELSPVWVPILLFFIIVIPISQGFTVVKNNENRADF